LLFDGLRTKVGLSGPRRGASRAGDGRDHRCRRERTVLPASRFRNVRTAGTSLELVESAKHTSPGAHPAWGWKKLGAPRRAWPRRNGRLKLSPRGLTTYHDTDSSTRSDPRPAGQCGLETRRSGEEPCCCSKPDHLGRLPTVGGQKIEVTVQSRRRILGRVGSPVGAPLARKGRTRFIDVGGAPATAVLRSRKDFTLKNCSCEEFAGIPVVSSMDVTRGPVQILLRRGPRAGVGAEGKVEEATRSRVYGEWLPRSRSVLEPGRPMPQSSLPYTAKVDFVRTSSQR